MRSVGIKILKNKLSHYVRLAAAGEIVLVTDRDRVVAELGPPTPGRAERLTDANLAQAVRSGWITPPVTGGPLVPARAPSLLFADLMSQLAEDREDRG